ncbi:MAG: hypothetical protein NTX45_18415 [Proteobacteria bacterium]|nr:hypothetical protein [Pseudomonadota bacterium]
MKTRHSKLYLALKTAMLVPIGLALVSGAASAATKTSVAAGGAWSTVGTWSPSGIPLATDDAVIAGLGAVTLLTSGSRVAANVTTNAGGQLTETHSGAILNVGGGGGLLTNNGTVQLNNGTINADVTTAGTFNQVAGTVTSTNFTVTAGTVTVNGGTQNFGTLNADGGTYKLNAGAMLLDTVNVAGGTVQLTNATNNIYVGTGYTNTGFGTGNSFNPTAGVTGLGAIRAQGDSVASGTTTDGALRQSIVGDVAIQAGAASGTLALNNVHVGDADQNKSFTVENKFSSDTPTVATLSGPSLTSAIGYTGTGLTGAGATPANLDTAWSADSGALAVTRSAATAGIVDGQTITVKSNLGDDQTINVTGGNVYQYATATAVTPSVVVGGQHVGNNNAGVAQSISLTNGNDAGVLVQETLGASAAATPDAVVVSGSPVTGIAGGATDSSLQAGVDTTTAGAKSGSIALTLTSEALAGSSLSNSSAGTSNVDVTGNVYNFAQGALGNATGAGTFAGGPTNYTLNFGSVVQSTGTYTANLAALNTAAAAFSDLLDGTFSLVSGSGFALTGFNAFTGLVGQGAHALSVVFDSAALGTFNEVYKFTWNGTNADIAGFVGTPSDILFTMSGVVRDSGAVPEPGIMWLFGSAGLAWFATNKKKAVKA